MGESKVTDNIYLFFQIFFTKGIFAIFLHFFCNFFFGNFEGENICVKALGESHLKICKKRNCSQCQYQTVKKQPKNFAENEKITMSRLRKISTKRISQNRFKMAYDS